MSGLSDALQEIQHERLRQESDEGWTPEHDDEHAQGELAQAAACYADPAPQMFADPRINSPIRWPRDWGGWNPKDRRSNLIRAGALIVAELERLERAAGPQVTAHD